MTSSPTTHAIAFNWNQYFTLTLIHPVASFRLSSSRLSNGTCGLKLNSVLIPAMYQIKFNVYISGIHTFAISDSTQRLSLLSCPVFCLLSFAASLFLHSSSMASHSALISGSTPSPSVAQIKFCVHHDNDFFSAAHWQYISKRLQYVYLLKSLMFIVTHPLNVVHKSQHHISNLWPVESWVIEPCNQ